MCFTGEACNVGNLSTSHCSGSRLVWYQPGLKHTPRPFSPVPPNQELETKKLRVVRLQAAAATTDAAGNDEHSRAAVNIRLLLYVFVSRS